jgi:hypothetical protein
MPTTDVPFLIEPGVLYLASEARRRLRIGDWAWREMRRDGLNVIYRGKQAYVFGDDVLAFFREQKEGQNN